jgi:hypothetical protein
VPAFMGVSVTNGFNFGTGGTNPGFFNSNGFQIANDLDCCAASTRCRSAPTGSTPTSRR